MLRGNEKASMTRCSRCDRALALLRQGHTTEALALLEGRRAHSESEDITVELELEEIRPPCPDVRLDIEGDALWVDVQDEWDIPDEVRIALGDLSVKMYLEGKNVLSIEGEVRRQLKAAVTAGTIKWKGRES